MNGDLSAVQIGSLQIFCKAAELGSFTAAAEAMGLTPAAVSRSVARLEQRLGVQLFARSTRQIRLTDNGQLYHEQCRAAVQQIEEAERAITGTRAMPAGTLRLSVPTTYGHFRLLPILDKFRQCHPQVRFDINISNRNIDFVDEGYDLAIRLGEPQDSRLVARRLEDASMGIYAAPAYLARRGVPQSLGELDQHDCIQFVLPSTGRPMAWSLRDGGRDVELTVDSAVRFSGDVLGCVGHALAGGGLFQTYDFIARSRQYQDLVEVLPESRGRSRPFSVLYPYHRHLSASVRALVAFLAEEVEALTTGAPV